MNFSITLSLGISALLSSIVILSEYINNLLLTSSIQHTFQTAKSRVQCYPLYRDEGSISYSMRKIANSEVDEVFENFPRQMRRKLMHLRAVILDAASELNILDKLNQSLKWGQPSYVAKGGSAIRLGLDKSDPDQYAMYLHCQTKLVSTFRQLFADEFSYEGNRAIVFDKNDKVDTAALKHCVILSLTYHTRKHLPMLGTD